MRNVIIYYITVKFSVQNGTSPMKVDTMTSTPTEVALVHIEVSQTMLDCHISLEKAER